MFIGLFSSSSTSRLLSSRATESSRIINGQAADVAAYPFLVSIRQFEDGFFAHCGGSVLRPNVVLTAAHCVTPPRTNPNEPFGTPSNSINNFLMPVVLTAADVPAGDPNSVPATGLVKTKAVVTSAGWNETNYVVGGFDLALLLQGGRLRTPSRHGHSRPESSRRDHLRNVGEPLTIAGVGALCLAHALRAHVIPPRRHRRRRIVLRINSRADLHRFHMYVGLYCDGAIGNDADRAGVGED